MRKALAAPSSNDFWPRAPLLRSGTATSTLAKATARELAGQGRVEAVEVDVTDLASVERAAAQTQAAFGRVDILVNNAGIAGPNTTTWHYPPDAWAQVLAINLTGPFHCARTLVPGMIARNYGRIVNIASIAGKEGNPNAPAYSASKAGLIALTKSLGKETAGYDISVNCLTPAAAKTAIFDQMTQEHIDFMLSKIPRARFVTVDEIAALAALLCVGRVLVHDRRGVRHLRRAGHLLSDPDPQTAVQDFARDRRHRLIGIALMCGAVAAFALLDATAKYLNHHMDTLQVVWRAIRRPSCWR